MNDDLDPRILNDYPRTGEHAVYRGTPDGGYVFLDEDGQWGLRAAGFANEKLAGLVVRQLKATDEWRSHSLLLWRTLTSLLTDYPGTCEHARQVVTRFETEARAGGFHGL